MIVFWIFAAGMVVLALLLVLPGLFRNRVALSAAGAPGAPSASRTNLSILRDQLAQIDADLASGSITAEQCRQLRGEVERRVLDEEAVIEVPRKVGSARRTAVVLGACIPLFALGVYAVKGNLAALDPQATQAAQAAQAAGGHDSELNAAQMEEMVDKLAKRLESQPESQPGDAQAWTMLARSYAYLQRLPEASRAFGRATALAPTDAQLLADHADVLAALQGRQLGGEPMRLIAKALQIDPDNPKALALAGTDAFDRKDFAAAVAYWSKARQVVPADSEFAKSLDGGIAEATAAGQGAGGTTAPAAAVAGATVPAAAPVAVAGSASPASPGGAQITGRVSLAPALAGRAAPTDTVFVFARATEGPRMPLAIVRRTVADLPFDFTLDDSTAMSPQMKLSNFPIVFVGVRISKSGNAMPQSGDLQGQAPSIKIGSGGVKLVVDAVQP